MVYANNLVKINYVLQHIYIRSTSEALNHALVELLIFTLYHIGDTGSSGVGTLSTISTVVPSWIVTTLSAEVREARGVDESWVLGEITTAVSCSAAFAVASEATISE